MSDYPSGPPNYGDQPGGWGQAPPPARGSSGKATAALVLGIVGLFCLICSILAVVFGYQARNEIDASGGMIGGRGQAKAGIILGWIGIGLTIVYIIIRVSSS